MADIDLVARQTRLPPGVSVSTASEGLAAIHDPNCAAALWTRATLPSFQNWLDALDPLNLPTARIILRPSRVEIALTQICASVGTPAGEHRDRLIEDISAQAQIFADLVAASYLRLRLDAVTTNACSKFHMDALTARLICTYRGRTTQLGQAARGEMPTDIYDVPQSSPLVLRASKWPTAGATNLLHRSPPIEGSGETRLVLVLDPVHDPDDEI